MQATRQLSILLSGILFLFALSGPAQARFKCWTNSEGIRECGETVPPEYVQQGHQEMSKQGVMLDEQERAKTRAELAEEDRLAVLEAEKQKIEEEKAKQDKILLDTFTSVADIENIRDDKLAVIESSITLTRKRNEKTQEDLDKRIEAAAAAERAGNAPNEALLEDIKILRARIEKNKAFIVGKRAEQETVTADAELDIERFRKLKGLE